MKTVYAFLIVILLPVMAFSQQPEADYFRPYVNPVSYAGNYLSVSVGQPAPSNLRTQKENFVGTLNMMLQGVTAPAFKTMLSVEAGWTFPKTKLAKIEMRPFGVTGDISLKAFMGKFDVKETPLVKASYTKSIQSVSLGTGIKLNFRIARKHLLRFGAKAYPTMMMAPELATTYTHTENGSTLVSRTVISLKDPAFKNNQEYSAYSAKAAPVFNLDYAGSVDVVLFKKLVLGVTYTRSGINTEYHYNSITERALQGVATWKETFKSKLDYTHISFTLGFFFSRGYKI